MRTDPGDGVLPVAQAAVAAADAAGTEVSGVELGGSRRGPRGRWAFLRLRRQQVTEDEDDAEPADARTVGGTVGPARAGDPDGSD